MMACVCPAATVSVTPARMGLSPPSGSLTETCRSRMSSVLMGGGLHYSVRGWRSGPGGRQPGRLPGAQFERGAVQPALQRAPVHLALGQRDLGVGTLVVDGAVGAVLTPHERDGGAVDLTGD